MNDEKIFGIGLCKTGTTSLGEVFKYFTFPYKYSLDYPYTMQVLKGDFTGVNRVIRNHSTFKGCPWSFIYQKLYEMYPNSKFILTVRQDADTWFRSLLNHCAKYPHSVNRKLRYGHYTATPDNKQDHVNVYNRYLLEVLAFFKDKPKDRFLMVCFETTPDAQLWEMLANFLGKSLPPPGTPFPHVNQSDLSSKKL